MLDYVNNIEVFKSKAELTLGNLIFKLITCCDDIDRGELLELFGFGELLDNLEYYTDIDKEKVISYLLDKYNITEATAIPFDGIIGSITQVVTGGNSGPIYWEQILGKPIPVTDLDQQQLENFILNLVPQAALYVINGGGANPNSYHPTQR